MSDIIYIENKEQLYDARLIIPEGSHAFIANNNIGDQYFALSMITHYQKMTGRKFFWITKKNSLFYKMAKCFINNDSDINMLIFMDKVDLNDKLINIILRDINIESILHFYLPVINKSHPILVDGAKSFHFKKFLTRPIYKDHISTHLRNLLELIS